MKKKYFKISAVFIFIIILFTCTNKDEVKNIKIGKNKDGKKISIKFKLGEHWAHSIKLGIMKVKITPQIAVWIEDKEGSYIDTLYVTKCFGKQEWKFVKYDPEKPLRISCMPYWMNKRKNAGNGIPTKNNPLVDEVTSATPKTNFNLETKIDDNLNEFVLLAEINKSFDGRQHKEGEEFTMDIVNGQPAVIYAVEINMNDNIKSYKLKYIGHAGMEGTDVNLYKDSEGITTAKQMTESIAVNIN